MATDESTVSSVHPSEQAEKEVKTMEQDNVAAPHQLKESREEAVKGEEVEKNGEAPPHPPPTSEVVVEDEKKAGEEEVKREGEGEEENPKGEVIEVEKSSGIEEEKKPPKGEVIEVEKSGIEDEKPKGEELPCVVEQVEKAEDGEGKPQGEDLAAVVEEGGEAKPPKGEELPIMEEVKTTNVDDEEKPKVEDLGKGNEEEKPKVEDLGKGNEEEKPKVEDLGKGNDEEKPKVEDLGKGNDEEKPKVEDLGKGNEEEKPSCDELPVISEAIKVEDKGEELAAIEEEAKKPDEEAKPKGEGELAITEEVKTGDDVEEKPKVEDLGAIEEVEKGIVEEKPICDELPVIAKTVEEEEEEKPKEEQQISLQVPSIEPEEKIEDQIPASTEEATKEPDQTTPEIPIDHEAKPVTAEEDVEKPLDESIKDADQVVGQPKTVEVPVPEPKIVQETKGQEEKLSAKEQDSEAPEPAVVVKEETAVTEKPLEQVTTPQKAEVFTDKIEDVEEPQLVLPQLAQCLEQETQTETKQHQLTAPKTDQEVEKVQEAKETAEVEEKQEKIDQDEEAKTIEPSENPHPEEAAQVKIVSRDTENKETEATEVEKKVDAATSIEDAQKAQTQVKEEVARAPEAAKHDESKDGNDKKDDNVVLVKAKQSNIMSKVKQTLVKAKKAIIGKSPTPKTETK